MLKVVATVNNRRTLFLGLERRNTERLHGDEPIVIDLQAAMAGIKGMAAVQDIVLFAAETPREVHMYLAVHLDRIGIELPPYREVGPDDPPNVFRRD